MISKLFGILNDTGGIGTWGIAIFTAFLVAGIVLQFRAFLSEQKKARRDAEFESYKQLDNVYYNIQTLIVGNPHLVKFNSVKTDDQRIQYDAFAFMVWNFIETIYDYVWDEAQGGLRNADAKSYLRETWEVIIQYEGQLHKIWLLDPKNKVKFKPRFYEAATGIANGQPISWPASRKSHVVTRG